MRVPELLIPASSLEVLKTAVIFGADAVYIGGEAFGLRAKAKNFSMEDMKEGIQFAHEHDVRVYVTANILAHNGDLPGVEEYFKELKEIGPDALIISDPGVFMIGKARSARRLRSISAPRPTIRTTAPTVSGMSQGAKRVVSARELSLKEIREIRSNIPGRSGDRDLRPRSHVHFLFRPLSSEQLFHRTGRQPGRLYPSLPLEICGGGGDKTRRVSAGL